MRIDLIRIGIADAQKLWKLQVEAFEDLYKKYQDTETSPATENVEKIIMRLKQPFMYYYYIVVDGIEIGAIRVVDKKELGKAKRISPIFIMKEHRGKGYAQEAIRAVELMHGECDWELDTILQEKGNCYFYEKMGYKKTDTTEVINEKLTLVFYKKD